MVDLGCGITQPRAYNLTLSSSDRHLDCDRTAVRGGSAMAVVRVGPHSAELRCTHVANDSVTLSSTDADVFNIELGTAPQAPLPYSIYTME